jgi:hypothetical protein
VLAHAWPAATRAAGHLKLQEGDVGTALLNTIAASATTSYLTSHRHRRPTPLLRCRACHLMAFEPTLLQSRFTGT